MTLLEFFNLNNIHCIIAIFISILNGVLLVLLAKKFFQILQISGYKIRGYMLWLKDTKGKHISRIALLSCLSLCCVLVINFMFDVYHSEALYSYIGLIFYVYFAGVLVYHVNKAPQKTPLVQTRRMSRLETLLFIIGCAVTFVLIWFATVYTPFLRFGIIVITPLILPLLVPLVHFILLPLEAFIRWTYIKAAKAKLDKMPQLIKIGITGSFGKTSTKYILNKMLSEKYNVCMSPHSFNTPMGLTKVVLKYLKKENEILIAEMGAKECGDIKYLCELIHPKHAIITGIGTQHYETFGSRENIIKTKYELIESLPEDGFAVFNCDNQPARELFDKCQLKNKISASVEQGENLHAENITVTSNGITFDLVCDNEKVTCSSKLLGRHNISNIINAATLALKLGVSLQQIQSAISELEPVGHRLEPKVNGNITILDDAYSSNEEGAMHALEVLSTYENQVKICITPGIVELGSEEKRINKEFGMKLGQVCDYVIIVNKVNEEALREGLVEAEFKEENIINAESLDQSKIKLKDLLKSEKKYVVLYLNDLPDNYK